MQTGLDLCGFECGNGMDAMRRLPTLDSIPRTNYMDKDLYIYLHCLSAKGEWHKQRTHAPLVFKQGEIGIQFTFTTCIPGGPEEPKTM